MVTETYAPVDDGSAGLLFAEAVGFRTALVDGMKVVDLPATEHLWEGLEEKAAPEHSDYRIVTWRDGVPEELVPGYCRLSELFNEQALMGELEVEAEKWDVDRVRNREKRNRATGRRDMSAGAVAPDGALVGVTEVGVDVHAPHWGFQRRDHRRARAPRTPAGPGGQAGNHRQLRAHFPDCRVLVTGNAPRRPGRKSRLSRA